VDIWAKAGHQCKPENYTRADQRGFQKPTWIYGCDLRGYIGAIPIPTTTKNHDNPKVLTRTMDGPLLYLQNHKVIVCSPCGHCIKPDGAELHLQRFHKDIKINQRKEWSRDVKQRLDNGDLVSPEDVVSPERAFGPVKELKIVDGFECSLCGYVCGKLVTAQLHGRNHGWQLGKDETWKSQPVQVFNYALSC
jgi:hypothetical protein